jgi:plasmid maintenance system antidote protein VapI
MLPDIETIKGIHPGIIIARELKNRRLKKKDLALFIDEHAQTISAIIKEKRSINPNYQ